VLACMVAKDRNPVLGDFVNPTPRAALPSYIGLRPENDSRFQNFLNLWAQWNTTLGYNDKRIRIH
jgi:polar amino acid transport system substrate-binding protein